MKDRRHSNIHERVSKRWGIMMSAIAKKADPGARRFGVTAVQEGFGTHDQLLRALSAQVELFFEEPLPVGFYTRNMLDYLYDPAGNELDGENFGTRALLQLPSGHGVPGRDFVFQFSTGRTR